MLSPTRRNFQEALSTEPAQEPVVNFSKGQVILIDGIQKIVIAKLQADQDIPITYSICDTDLRNPQFGVSLTNASLAENITHEISLRAKYFL